MPQYEPKYISLDEVPVQIPDEYSDREKASAIEVAEGMLETDLNGGDVYDNTDDFTTLYYAALKNRATCELAYGTEHPDDTGLSDLRDDGSVKAEYSNRFCEVYADLIDKIKENEAEEDGGEDDFRPEYVYNTQETDAKESRRDRYDTYVDNTTE